ncbi:MAG: Hint domain-containing protein [Myxococcota bacterium]
MRRLRVDSRVCVLPLAFALQGCLVTDSCIAEGALVLTSRGLRPIESLIIDDAIVSLDPASGEMVSSAITRIVSTKRECVVLRAGDVALRCTPSHPLFDPDAGEFAPASAWVDGTRTALAVVRNEQLVRVDVDEVQMDGGVARVFDLTVESALHNFVADGVLVHNKSIDVSSSGEGLTTEVSATDGETDDTSGTMGGSTTTGGELETSSSSGTGGGSSSSGTGGGSGSSSSGTGGSSSTG